MCNPGKGEAKLIVFGRSIDVLRNAVAESIECPSPEARATPFSQTGAESGWQTSVARLLLHPDQQTQMRLKFVEPRSNQGSANLSHIEAGNSYRNLQLLSHGLYSTRFISFHKSLHFVLLRHILSELRLIRARKDSMEIIGRSVATVQY